MRLLLVEDDPAMLATLQRSFTRRGFDVGPCAGGRDALARWPVFHPDVVVLDLSLPDLDGLEVLAQARRAGWREPVLILTARGTVGDRILGLNTGADDYLPKPFDLDELEARIRALARRAAPAGDGAAGHEPPPARLGLLTLDRVSGAVHGPAGVLELSPRELALLQALLARPGQAVTRERLLELVFPGDEEVQPDAIEVVVYRLRRKLAGTGTALVTLRGLGYLLKAAVA